MNKDMIKDILKLLEKNKEVIKFELDGFFNQSKVQVSKFSHADQKPYRKVLFLVTYKGVPKVIVKIMRSPEYNDKLQSECEKQKKAMSDVSDFYVPKVLFEDKIGDLFVYGEEAITGEPLQQSDARELLPRVFQYQKHIPKIKSISSNMFITLLDSMHLPLDKEYMKIRTELEVYRNIQIPLGYNHGDMTVRNLIRDSHGTLALIDWENYTDKLIWGLDAIHFFIRGFAILSLQDFLLHADVLKPLCPEEDGKYFEFLYLMDYVYDIFQKDLPLEYYAIFMAETKKLL